MLPEVTVISIPRSYWGKQRLYNEVKRYLDSKGATAEQIVQPSLRELVERIDGIEAFLERVHERPGKAIS